MDLKIKTSSMRSVYIITMLIFICQFVFCQNDSIRMHMLGRSELDGIRLRWLVKDPNELLIAFKNGFEIKRAIFDKNKSQALQDYKPISQYIFKRANNASWNEYKSKHPLKSDDVRVIYAHMAEDLSNKQYALTGKEKIDEIIAFKKDFDNVRTYILLAADMNWDAAVLLGLGFLDKDAKKGQAYVYQLKAIDQEIDPVYLEIVHDFKESDNKANIKVIENDKKITLTWKTPNGVNGYFIEKSMDNKSFEKNNKVPFFLMKTGGTQSDTITSYEVDSLINYKWYYFKVYGTTPFGDDVLIGTAKGMPRDKTAPKRPLMKVAKHIEPDKAEISWDMSDPLEDDIAGFIIGRSTQDDGDYYAIHDGLIHKDKRRFEDIYFSKDSSNYYIVEVVDTSGNRSRSDFSYLTLIDTVPPGKPIHIKSKMDSLGIVTLQLEPQKEKDFMGYRIYKTNADDHEFSVVQETYNDTIVEVARKPIITDTSTVKSLTKYIYYKVTALDYHYNESKPSEMIKVKRPDIYPPVAPVIHDFLVTDTIIRLDFIPSSSSDVVRHFMMRKKSSEENWSILDTLGVNQHTYFDKSCITDISYDYAIRAQDDSDMFSPFSNVLTLKTYRKSRPAKIDITCVYDTNAKTTTIAWILKEKIQDMTQLQIYDISKNAAYINSISPENEGKYTFPSPQIINKVGLKLLTGDFDFLISESNNCKILK